MEILPRVAGRLDSIVNLNMSFYHNGVLESPFAIRRVDIFRGSLKDSNLVAQVALPGPSDTSYPFPATEFSDGLFELPFAVPDSFVSNEIYYDVWRFIAEPATDIDDESNWFSQNGQFWVFDDVWIVDDLLRTLRLGFEPLDRQFRRGEIRNLEIAIHPLPLYDYDFNKTAPIIPRLNPTITIWTTHDELLIQDEPCKIGVKQGHHRNSPFVVQCLLDTTSFIVGTYRYMIKVNIDNRVIASDKFHFVIL